MDASEKELVRKVLTAILARLEGGGLTSAESQAADKNLVVVVLNEAGAPNVPKGASLPNQVSQIGGVIHPGFERFAVSQHCSSDSAPRTCFLEPDKVCVNSGACEMRGH